MPNTFSLTENQFSRKNYFYTIHPCLPRETLTAVQARSVHVCATLGRCRNARVEGILTGLPHEAGGALASVGVDPVAAGAAVGAWVGRAVVHVQLAGRPGVPRRAEALVAVDLVPAGGVTRML